MRTLLVSLLLLSSGTWYLIENPNLFSRASEGSEEAMQYLFYAKTLSIQGLKILKEEALREELPLEKSNFWWRSNLSSIEARLSSIPLVQKSKIEPCAWWSVGCYEISVVERSPAFVAIARDQSKAWVIGDDGGFMTPLTNEQFRRGALNVFGDSSKELVIVYGLWAENSSADNVRARILSLGKALRILKEELPKEVVSVTLGKGRDMEVRFRGLPFVVYFQLYGDELREKASKLRMLLGEIKGEYEKIDAIDFGFSTMAVMRLKEAPDRKGKINYRVR